MGDEDFDEVWRELYNSMCHVMVSLFDEVIARVFHITTLFLPYPLSDSPSICIHSAYEHVHMIPFI